MDFILKNAFFNEDEEKTEETEIDEIDGIGDEIDEEQIDEEEAND